MLFCFNLILYTLNFSFCSFVYQEAVDLYGAPNELRARYLTKKYYIFTSHINIKKAT